MAKKKTAAKTKSAKKKSTKKTAVQKTPAKKTVKKKTAAQKSAKKNAAVKKVSKKAAGKKAVRKKATGKKAVKKKLTKKKAIKKATPKKATKKKTSRKKVAKAKGNAVRRFELVDDSSSKFWEISQNGSKFTVRYGRIGTDGQAPKTKDMGTSEKAAAEVEKLIRAKTGKGYAETANTAGTTGVSEKASRKKAVKKTSGSSAAPTAEQKTKVRKLLKSKDAGNVKLAIGLLESTDATKKGWNDAFSTTVLSQLVNTWDVDVWNVVTAAFQTHKSLLKDFSDLAVDRFGKLSEPKQNSFLKMVLPSLQPQMSPTIGRCLSKHQGWLDLNGLTSLSDAAAESLSSYKGWLNLDGLTSLSDAAAESLSKHRGTLSLDGLTSLSDAAVESLSKHKGGYLYLNGLTSLAGAGSITLGIAKLISKSSDDGDYSLAATDLRRRYGGLPSLLEEKRDQQVFRLLFAERITKRIKQVQSYYEKAESRKAIARFEDMVLHQKINWKKTADFRWCSSCSVKTAVLLSGAAKQNRSEVKIPGFLGFYEVETHRDYNWSECGEAIVRYLEKVPGYGPRCKTLAGHLIELMVSAGDPLALGQLLRVAREVKLLPVKNWIETRVSWIAEELGLTTQEIEDTCIDTHGLVSGRKEVTGGGLTGVKISTHSGKPEAWTSANGKIVPLDLKALKKSDKKVAQVVTAELKEIQSTWKACILRLESSWCSNGEWTWRDLKRFWFDHPLVSELAKRVIWRFERNGTVTEGLWLKKGFTDAAGKPLKKIAADTNVTVWHSTLSPQTVEGWRRRILELEMEQPFRQAFREVYLVTNAERQSGDSSARFAGHILRQNQFAALCRQLGWSVDREGTMSIFRAEKQIKTQNLTIGWPCDPVGDSGEYIRMNPVTFSVPVSKIDPVVFSEVMRDIDLFVSVSSIGVDPTWDSTRDNPQMQQYWTSFTNGEVFESGKTRRETLELLLPSLPQSDQFSLDKKYLNVTGRLGSYRIHLQSGAVFKRPGNAHVCIVPKSTAPRDPRTVMLGDQMLSLIVSKALLLANDDQIKSRSILSQIGKDQ